MSVIMPENFKGKIIRKLRSIILPIIQGNYLQFALYPSYWHMRFYPPKRDIKKLEGKYFLGAKPNYGAGIGHQLANWNAGLHYAMYFNISFAAFPFSTSRWTTFLGLTEDEVQANDLLKNRNIKKVRLPLFDENSPEQLKIIKCIIESYKKQETDALFILEQDQFWKEQYSTTSFLSKKFFSATARKTDKIQYDNNCINIAVHIRRGDITGMQDRWLDNKYYLQLISQIRAILCNKNYMFYIFTQEKGEGISDFINLPYTTIMEGNTDTSDFLHLCLADILITSRSSFSYKPALISKGVKIVPCDFWHEYPNDSQWVIANKEGKCNTEHLHSAIKPILTKNRV